MAYFCYLPTIPTSTSAPLCPISSSPSSSFARRSFTNFHHLKTLITPLMKKHNVLCMNSYNDDNQVAEEIDYTNTPYIPVYVKLPLDVVNMKCELRDEGKLERWLKKLKDIGVDGVEVDCWWGIVERHEPEYYNWRGYRRLFQIARKQDLKLQVKLSFHACGGNAGDNVHIPLPRWVHKIGESNPNIYFTDRGGWRNPECLTWGIDTESVLSDRTAAEVYSDYMESFRVNFREFFYGFIHKIEIGLGPSGELRYPSCPKERGWKYPGIGEFQYFDEYLMNSLTKAAEPKGHRIMGTHPRNVGSYNSHPHDTKFFCDQGEYDGYFGRFFLSWYSQLLVDHADLILHLASLTFDRGPTIGAKISGVHWYYSTTGHAAELTAGYYNSNHRDGYASIASMLKKHDAILNFTGVELCASRQQQKALSYPELLVWQVMNAGWDAGISVAAENALPCHEKHDYNKILENAKPLNDPKRRHLSTFTYGRLSDVLMEGHNLYEFVRFVRRMHGKSVNDLRPLYYL